MNMKSVFGTEKPIIGMLHLRGGSEAEVMRIAREEIEMMYANGVDAVLAENYFGSEADVERALALLSSEYSDRVYGVNLLGAGLKRPMELACRYGAKFVQFDSVCGHLRPKQDERFAAEIKALREKYPVFVMGGVRFKYQPVNSGRTVQEDIRLGMERCDAIVITGAGTAMETDEAKIRAFREAAGSFPLIVGAGMTPETVGRQLALADGGIVGSSLKRDGVTHLEMDAQRVARFMQAAKAAR